MGPLTAISTKDERVELSSEEIDEFKSQLRGDLIDRSSAGYDETRALWNGMIDRKPALIVHCSGAADIIAAVKFARKHDLKISVRGGGHHVAGKAVCDAGMVIDLSGMHAVQVDREKSTALVQAGARLADIDHETSAFGLAAPLGVVSATGVAGLTLHGGYGWQTRKYGLSLDNLMSVDIVTAEGKLLKASKNENPDLFWAIRGGGGNFGIVTSFEFKLNKMAPEVWLLLTIYPIEMAAKGLKLFNEYMTKAPDELGAIAIFWNAPNEDFIPADYRMKPVFIYVGCYTGPLKDGEKALAPLRQLGKPVADLSAPMPFEKVQQVLDVDFPNGRRYYWKSSYLDELNDESIAMLIDMAAKRPSPLSSLDVWALGGKVNRIDPTETAFFQRNHRYMIGIESNWDDANKNDANIEWPRSVFERLTSIFDAGIYMNFPGFGEEGDNLLKKTYGSNYKRLKQIKKKYDPDNFFNGFMSF